MRTVTTFCFLILFMGIVEGSVVNVAVEDMQSLRLDDGRSSGVTPITGSNVIRPSLAAVDSDTYSEWMLVAEMETLGDDSDIESGSESAEDSLTPPLPPSVARRRWGFVIFSLLFFTILCLGYTLRSYIPYIPASLSNFHLPSLPYQSLPSLPTFNKPTLGARRRSRQPKRYRPAPSSLLRWTLESDPGAKPLSSSGTSASGNVPRSPFLGDLEEELEDEGDYEQVGLLPSPSPYRPERKNYGAVGDGNGL